MATCGWIVHTIGRDAARIETLLEENHRNIEALQGAFTTLWFDDHFQKDHSPIYESWTTLTYLAALYPQMQVGSVVLCQSYRNPALLAKMTATLQTLTGGRYIAGIGAGWKEDEYHAYGYEFPGARIRLEQLEEAVQILRLMWSRSPASFLGKHYRVVEADCEPLPNPPPPLLIGGGGEKRTLRIVAKYADWMNLAFADPPKCAHSFDVLRRHCQEVGRPSDEIKKSLWAYVHLSPTGEKPVGIAGDRYIISGTPRQVRDTFRAYLNLGVEHFMLRFQDFPRLDGLQRFCDEVLPAVAQA